MPRSTKSLDWAVAAGYIHVNDGPGAEALNAFARRFAVTAADDAMVLACRRLREQVEAAGWEATLPAFVRAFGLRVVEGPITQAGRLDYEDARYVIRVKAADPTLRADQELDPQLLRGRQRFSVAHELGHVLLMQHLADSPELLLGLRDPDEWERIESLCDQAAAELLVPVDSFISSVCRHGFCTESIHAIAREFAVSHEVIFRRFIACGARTAAIWRVGNVPGGGLVASVRAAVSGHTGPYLRVGTDSRCLGPNLIIKAATRGHARSAKLKLTSGTTSWRLAGVAQASSASRETGPVHEQEVVLLLFHDDPVKMARQLWLSVAQWNGARSKLR